jgi:hypothetical protein
MQIRSGFGSAQPSVVELVGLRLRSALGGGVGRALAVRSSRWWSGSGFGCAQLSSIFLRGLSEAETHVRRSSKTSIGQ